MKGHGGVFGDIKSTKAETLPHFFTKMMVMKLLQEKRHKAMIEVPVGHGTVDCYDFTTKYAYEIEPRVDRKKLKMKFDKYSLGGAEEVIMIPYKELFKLLEIAPENLRKWRKAIDNYLNA